ncbi:hypothetical protein KLP28_11240 [Nocardioidaceae bacterium]|nr:hypothetical protein KLP28_11240 [Nocardioidaceae bacterium]
MPYLDPRWSEPIWGVVGDVLRYLGWVCVGGLIAVGACWCGGVVAMQAYREWQRTGPPRRHGHTQGAVEREAARGIREIEVFLGAGTTHRSES